MINQKNLCPVCLHLYVGDFKMSTHLVTHSSEELGEVIFDEIRHAGFGYCVACDVAVVGSFDTAMHIRNDHDVQDLAEAIFMG